MTKSYCLVCGWDGLNKEPYLGSGDVPSFETCPSCGFEYGFDDNPSASGNYPSEWNRQMIVDAYRKQWIDGGMLWWSEKEKAPAGRDPKRQLLNIGVEL